MNDDDDVVLVFSFLMFQKQKHQRYKHYHPQRSC